MWFKKGFCVFASLLLYKTLTLTCVFYLGGMTQGELQYKLTTTEKKLNQTSAVSSCMASNARLVSVYDDDIKEKLRKLMTRNGVWTSAKLNEENIWVWPDKQIVNESSVRVVNASKVRNCLRMIKARTFTPFKSTRCDSELYYYCISEYASCFPINSFLRFV